MVENPVLAVPARFNTLYLPAGSLRDSETLYFFLVFVFWTKITGAGEPSRVETTTVRAAGFFALGFSPARSLTCAGSVTTGEPAGVAGSAVTGGATITNKDAAMTGASTFRMLNMQSTVSAQLFTQER